jgi:thioredoxin reductase (NADPH)
MLGSDLIDQTKKQAQTFGALVVPDTVTSVDFSSWPYTLKTEEGHEVHALAVIIATGANPRLLSDTRPVKGEKEFFGYGVTTCAICDAPFYKGKKVVVVGGGDSAIEEATLLTSYAQSVILLVRGDKMRAAKAMQERIKDSPKITVRYNTEIAQITGDTKVTGVTLRNTKTNTTEDIPIDGVFLAIGHKPNTAIVAPYLSLDPEGYIILSTRFQKTSVPGVFAAGDVSDRIYRQAGVAAGDGIKAALDAISFLQEHGFNEKLVQELEKNYFEPEPETPLALTQLTSVKEFEKLSKEHEFLVVEVGAEYCASCKALARF